MEYSRLQQEFIRGVAITDNLLRGLLNSAISRQEALPAFNVHNLEFMEGAVRAAQLLRGRCILEVSPKTLQFVDLSVWFRLAQTVMTYYCVRVPLHLDHSVDAQLCRQAITMGFDSVMFDGSHLSLAENVKITSEIVRIAHDHEVLVEGEVGPITHDPHTRLSIEDIRMFAGQTHVDMLASGFGTEHGAKTEWLDIERIETLARIGTPLVLHGSSGLASDWLARAVKAGVRKVNVGTALNRAFMSAFQGCQLGDDPRNLLEKGREQIVAECLRYARSLMKEVPAS